MSTFTPDRQCDDRHESEPVQSSVESRASELISDDASRSARPGPPVIGYISAAGAVQAHERPRKLARFARTDRVTAICLGCSGATVGSVIQSWPLRSGMPPTFRSAIVGRGLVKRGDVKSSADQQRFITPA